MLIGWRQWQPNENKIWFFETNETRAFFTMSQAQAALTHMITTQMKTHNILAYKVALEMI